MAKKQTRRSISVSRATYERLKAFCEANNTSMSQVVEKRVEDFLGSDPRAASLPARPMNTSPRSPELAKPAPPRTPPVMTSAAARHAIEPPPPIIRPRTEQPAPPPAAKTADQIFTF